MCTVGIWYRTLKIMAFMLRSQFEQVYWFRLGAHASISRPFIFIYLFFDSFFEFVRSPETYFTRHHFYGEIIFLRMHCRECYWNSSSLPYVLEIFNDPEISQTILVVIYRINSVPMHNWKNKWNCCYLNIKQFKYRAKGWQRGGSMAVKREPNGLEHIGDMSTFELLVDAFGRASMQSSSLSCHLYVPFEFVRKWCEHHDKDITATCTTIPENFNTSLMLASSNLTKINHILSRMDSISLSRCNHTIDCMLELSNPNKNHRHIKLTNGFCWFSTSIQSGSD